MASILIKNGYIVTADAEYDGDILVVDGKISQIAKNGEKNIESPEPGTRVIDASGLLVIPGGIDPHVHMELPVGNGLVSADDFESGTAAALVGGTTAIIDFVTPESGQSLIEAFHLRKKAAEKSLCDYGLHMSITEWIGSTQEEMRQCVEQEGMPSFKVYMAYKKAIGLDDVDILRVMDTAARLKARVLVHCEHGETVDYLRDKYISMGKNSSIYHSKSRPVAVEREAEIRAMLMAQQTGCPLYIVHDSTGSVLADITESGHDVVVETCPHYLLLDESEYSRPGFEGAAYVMSPPLRPPSHKARLWKGIACEDIRVVATDHCPFNMKGDKERGINDFTRIPNGVAGVENRMALLYTFGVLDKKISHRQWVSVTSTAAAQVFGLYPRKGTLAAGSDGDIVLWDPDVESVVSAKTHKQNCDTNIYEGYRLKGQSRIVILNGRIVYENGILKQERGAGKYLYRKLP